MEAAGLLGVDEDGREARRRAGDARRAKEYRARRKAASPPSGVTVRDAGANEILQKSTFGDAPGQRGGRPVPTDPDADLPPFDPTRRVIRSRADAFHAPHLEPQAKMVVDHYAHAVGKPALETSDAIPLIMDLLAGGVEQHILLLATEGYAAHCKAHRHPPMGTAAFFAFRGDWRNYRPGTSSKR